MKKLTIFRFVILRPYQNHFISLFLILSILSSCVSYKSVIISKNEPFLIFQKTLILHSNGLYRYFDKVSLENDQLYGNVTFQRQSHWKSNLAIVYLDTTITFNYSEERISIPISAIKKVEAFEPDTYYNTIMSITLVCGIVGIIMLFTFDVGPLF